VQALTESTLVAVRVGKSDKTCAILIKDANGGIRSSPDQDPDGWDPSAGHIEDFLRAARDILAGEADTDSGKLVSNCYYFHLSNTNQVLAPFRPRLGNSSSDLIPFPSALRPGQLYPVP
jgi:hypothetical protein